MPAPSPGSCHVSSNAGGQRLRPRPPPPGRQADGTRLTLFAAVSPTSGPDSSQRTLHTHRICKALEPDVLDPGPVWEEKGNRRSGAWPEFYCASHIAQHGSIVSPSPLVVCLLSRPILLHHERACTRNLKKCMMAPGKGAQAKGPESTPVPGRHRPPLK